MILTSTPHRRAAATVEAALVVPVVVILVLGMIVGGLGVFHYQQVTCLAQEAARYASVRGGEYQGDWNVDSPTAAQISSAAVLPMAVSMDTTALAVSVLWVDQSTGVAQAWDGAPLDVKSVTSGGEYVANTVRVTVTYAWNPGIFISPIQLTGTVEVPMSY